MNTTVEILSGFEQTRRLTKLPPDRVFYAVGELADWDITASVSFVTVRATKLKRVTKQTRAAGALAAAVIKLIELSMTPMTAIIRVGKRRRELRFDGEKVTVTQLKDK